MLRLLTLTVALALSLTIPAGARAMAGDYANALDAWGRVLADFVDDQGRTDFDRLSEHPEDLREFVAFIADFGPETAPDAFPTREDVLAYHANSYNALAMVGVIDEGIPEGFSSFFKRAGFFKFRSVRLDGRKTNLYDYENKVIRPLDEPRIHFALNCMVRDCPRLPMTPFSPASLDADLDALTREFFSKEKHLRVNESRETILVSAILDFYTRDFVASGKARDLPQYINPYLDEPLPPDYRVKFIKYDWTINRQPQ